MWQEVVVFCAVLAFGIFFPSAAQSAFPVLATEGRPQNDETIHTDLIPDRREGKAIIPEGLPIELLSLLSNATNRRNSGTIHTDLIRNRREAKSRSVDSCKCARRPPSGRRIGGVDSDSPKYKYPYQVYVNVTKWHINKRCGGTIINKRYVVTAMHCFYDGNINEYIPANKIFIIAGEHNVQDGINEGGQSIPVDYFIPNPDYYIDDRDRAHVNDIAILKLKNDITFTNNVKPACLPSDNTKTYAGQWGIVTGWGGTVRSAPFKKQKMSDTLKETYVKIWGSRKCAQHTYTYPNTLICAFKSGTGPCGGDSGGPLTVVENGKYILVGVVSHGIGCASTKYPSKYTRVTNYLSWIRQNTQDGDC